MIGACENCGSALAECECDPARALPRDIADMLNHPRDGAVVLRGAVRAAAYVDCAADGFYALQAILAHVHDKHDALRQIHEQIEKIHVQRLVRWAELCRKAGR